MTPISDDTAAHQAICDLLARYARTADQLVGGDASSELHARHTFDQIFLRDAHIEVLGQISVRGTDAWLRVIAESSEGLLATQHLLGHPVIDLDGDRATLTFPLQATRFGPRREIRRIFGRYEATATCAGDSRWKLSRLSLEIVAIDPPLEER